MDILITSIVDPRRSAYGRLHEIARHLSRKNTVTVLTVRDAWKGSQRASAQYEQQSDRMLEGIRIVYIGQRLQSPVLQEVFSFWLERSFLQEIDGSRFDLIFDYNTILTGLRASRRMRNVPRIYDLADDLSDMIRVSPQMPSILSGGAARLSHRWIRKSVRNAAAVTGTTKALLAEYDAPQGTSTVIPNGVPPDFLFSIPSDEVVDKRQRPQELLIGYVGVLREWIDFVPVFDAMNKISRNVPVRLIIIGEEGDKKKIQSEAREYGVSDLVTMLGTLPHNEIRRYLAACDCGVIPFAKMQTAKYALPLKLFEYLSLGIPTLSTPINAIKESFAGDVNFYETGDELAAHLNRLSSDSAPFREQAGRGRMKVRDNYTWDRILEKFDLTIEQVV